MKPLVYFDFVVMENNKVMVDKERLREILDEIYQAGYTDGQNAPRITTLNHGGFEVGRTNTVQLGGGTSGITVTPALVSSKSI